MKKIAGEDFFTSYFNERLLFAFSKEHIANAIQKFIFVSRVMLLYKIKDQNLKTAG